MTDYFALLGDARRPWLDPEQLKEKYFTLARERPADSELNEAFRVLSDPKLRLHHLLVLEGADLTAGRPVPPAVTELFWDTGTILREVDRWLLKSEEASGALARALLSGERARLEQRLTRLDEQLNRLYEAELDHLRTAKIDWPNEMERMIERYDSIAYLTRLRERMSEKRLGLEVG